MTQIDHGDAGAGEAAPFIAGVRGAQGRALSPPGHVRQVFPPRPINHQNLNAILMTDLSTWRRIDLECRHLDWDDEHLLTDGDLAFM